MNCVVAMAYSHVVDPLEIIAFFTVAVTETAGIRGFVLFLGIYI